MQLLIGSIISARLLSLTLVCVCFSTMTGQSKHADTSSAATGAATAVKKAAGPVTVKVAKRQGQLGRMAQNSSPKAKAKKEATKAASATDPFFACTRD